MRLFLSLALLVALAAVAQGRRLQLDVKCNDLDWLAGNVPEASSIVSVIKALGLLPGGLPPNTTVFLPNNQATAQLPAVLDMPFILDTIVDAAPTLGPEVLRRLNSAILYQIAPVGALEPDALLKLGRLRTALAGAPLKVLEPLPGSFTLEDSTGQQADIVSGPADAPRFGCSAAVYIVDKVLLPKGSLNDLPKVTAAAANQAVTGDGVVVVDSVAGFGQPAPGLAAAAPAPSE